jgi:hypothetical protein
MREYDDMSVYVIGAQSDNELIVSDVLDLIHECFDTIFPRGINRKSLTDNMLPVILIIDELIDEGIIMTTDTDVVLDRIDQKKKIHTSDTKQSADAPKEESIGGGYSFASVFASAKNSLAKTLAL